MGRMTGIYCISRGEAGGTSYRPVLRNVTIMRGMVSYPGPGPIEPVDSVVRTSGPDEPVNGDTRCWTGGGEYDDNVQNVVLPQTGSDESVDSVVCTTGSNEPVDSVVCTSGPDEPVGGDTPCGTGDEEDVDYEGNVVLPRTGSDESVDSVVRTSGPDEPVSGVTPCWISVEECVVHVGEVSLPRTGYGEPVYRVAHISGLDDPGGSCAEDGKNYESVVALHRTGSDQSFNKVVSIVGPKVDKGSLDKIRMWEINPRLELKMHYKSSHSILFREGVCHQPGAASFCRLTQIRLRTGGKSF